MRSNYVNGKDSLFFGDGAGNFTKASLDGVNGSASHTLFDLDYDGDLDIFASGGVVRNYLWENDGQGNFVPRLEPEWNVRLYTVRTLVHDFNNDGIQDFILLNTSGDSLLYTGSVRTTLAVDEKLPSIGSVAVQEVNSGDALEYSLAAGADADEFTIDPQTAELSPVDLLDFLAPADADANNTYEIVVRATDNGTPTRFTQRTFLVNVLDTPEVATVRLDLTSLAGEIGEGDGVVQVPFIVSGADLSSASSQDVTVTLSSGDARAGTDYDFGSPQTLTVPPVDYTTPVTLTLPLEVFEDELVEAEQTLEFTLDTNAAQLRLDPATTSTLTLRDNDVPALLVQPASGLSLRSGETGEYSLQLVARPATPVTVALASDSEILAPDTTRFVFTPDNWNQPQTVALTAQTDPGANSVQDTLTFSVLPAESDTLWATTPVLARPVEVLGEASEETPAQNDPVLEDESSAEDTAAGGSAQPVPATTLLRTGGRD